MVEALGSSLGNHHGRLEVVLNTLAVYWTEVEKCIDLMSKCCMM